MKRIAAVICMMTVLMTCFWGTGSVFADDFLINMSFNGYATNETPSDLNVKSLGYYVTEYAAKDKGLKIINGKNENKFTIPVNAGKVFTVSFDVKLDGADETEGSFRILNGNAEYRLLKFGKDRTASLYDGNPVGGISSSVMTRFTVVADLERSVYSVYQNGEKKCNEYYIKDLTFTGISGIAFAFSKSETPAILDNINVINGVYTSNAFPVETYSDEVTELQEVTQAEPKVFLNCDVDNMNDAIWITNSNEANVYTEEDGNRCIRVTKTTSNSMYSRVSFSSNDYSRIIWEMDLKMIDPDSEMLISSLGSVSRYWSVDITLKGGIIYANDEKAAKINSETWTNIAAAFNFETLTYDLYVNKKLIRSYIGLKNAVAEEFTDFNLEVAGGDTVCDMLVDNFRCYEGEEPRSFEQKDYSDIYKEPSPINFDSKYEKMLSGFSAIHLKSGVIYKDGKKTVSDEFPYIKDDRTMMPVRAMCEAFGFDIGYDNITKKVTVGERAELTIGKKSMTVDGNTIELDVAPEIRNGRTFLPMRALCENILGKTVTYDASTGVNAGIVFVGNSEFTMPKNAVDSQKLCDFLFYIRPSDEKVISDFKAFGSENKHPRIMIDSDGVTKLREEVKKYPAKKKIADALIASADSMLNTPAPVYGRYDSIRMASTPASQNYTLGMAYLLTGDKKYVDAAWVRMNAMCTWGDWNPTHYLDTSEIAAGIAVGYDWMYDAFTPEQRKIIEEGLYKNGLYETALWQHGVKGDFNRWYTSGENWNIICNSNMMIAALSVLDVYPEMASNVISNSLRGLEYAIFEFAPDGAWFEGADYWDYMMPYFTRMLDSMDKILGTDYSISYTEGFSKTMYYFVNMQSDQGLFNFGDADPKKNLYPEPLLWCSNRFNDPGITSLALQKTGGNIISACALIWLNPEIGVGEANMDLDYWAANVDAVTMRGSWTDSNAAYLAYHGGRHGVDSRYTHNDLDGGSFVFDTQGERWAMDMGKDDYFLTGYWNANPNVVSGEYRWKIFRKRAEGHNTIIINPDGTGVDHVVESSANVLWLKSKPRAAMSAVDLSENLAVNANSAKRGFMLTDSRKSMVVRDEINLKKQSEVYWHMYTRAELDEQGDNFVVLTMNGKKLKVEFACSAPYELVYEPAKPLEGSPTVAGENSNAGIYRIQLKASASGNLNITAKLTPEGVDNSPVSNYDKPIDSWTLEDGELSEAPTLNMIYADNEQIADFDKFNKNYVIKYIEGETRAPEFTIEKDRDTVVTIESDGTYNKPVSIKVAEVNNENNFSLYTVTFEEIPRPVNLDELNVYNPTNIIASLEPEPENKKENVNDNNFDTRWSAQGTTGDCYIDLDLGEKVDIDTVIMATYSGDTRSLYFDISLSDDGQNYTKVYDGMTSGKTTDFEQFNFTKKAARFVRITGYGTTEAGGTWNSITELRAALKK